MKIHKIVFFVGLLLIINQFPGIPSFAKDWIDIILGILLIGLGIYMKLHAIKKVNSDAHDVLDHGTFSESKPVGSFDGEVATETITENSIDNALDENINEQISSLENFDESEETQ